MMKKQSLWRASIALTFVAAVLLSSMCQSSHAVSPESIIGFKNQAPTSEHRRRVEPPDPATRLPRPLP